MQNETELKKSICAYAKIAKNNKPYIKFTIEDKNYIMYKNDYKVRPTQPDYLIYQQTTKGYFQQKENKDNYKPNINL
jgi:hypothetical protein